MYVRWTVIMTLQAGVDRHTLRAAQGTAIGTDLCVYVRVCIYVYMRVGRSRGGYRHRPHFCTERGGGVRGDRRIFCSV
jgi:hypothetical protein